MRKRKNRFRPGICAALSVCGLLGACTFDLRPASVAPPPPLVIEQDPRPEPPIAVRPAPAAQPAPRPQPAAPPANEPAGAADARPRAAQPQKFIPDPAMLVGLAPDQVRRLLGPPVAVRESPPATVWQYFGSECVFEVYLYREVRLDTLRALGYGLLGARQTDDAKRACFSEIWQGETG